eukprot:COSAG02_NODE_358_length_23882_cov_25.508683_17_plen_101_part_00
MDSDQIRWHGGCGQAPVEDVVDRVDLPARVTFVLEPRSRNVRRASSKSAHRRDIETDIVGAAQWVLGQRKCERNAVATRIRMAVLNGGAVTAPGDAVAKW